MANKIPSWFKDAVATPLGWAHPLTGEQLVANNALEDTIGYYKPNAGANSFLTGAPGDRTMITSMVRVQTATLGILSLDKITSVFWELGDGDIIEGGTTIKHTYAGEGSYTVYARVLFEGAEDAALFTINVVIGDAAAVEAPIIEQVYLLSGVELNDPTVRVGTETTALVSFGGTPDFSTLIFDFEWYKDDELIPGTRFGRYVPLEEDLGSMLKVLVTVSNAAGSASMMSDPVEVLAAAP